MSVKYRTYCKKAPKTRVSRKLIGSHLNKPGGGLWGCRGDEWIEWCTENNFRMNDWKECFEWELKKGAKVLTIRSVSGFVKLIKKYFKYIKVEGLPCYGTIDFEKIAKEYDAIELTDVPVQELHFGVKVDKHISISEYLDHGRQIAYNIGTNCWDVPSICVLNTDKVKVLRRLK